MDVDQICVSKQGTIVDRIDYNITNVAASVEDGLRQLQKVLPHFSFDLLQPSQDISSYFNTFEG